MSAYNVTLIPGDGIGPEVTEATRRVLAEGLVGCGLGSLTASMALDAGMAARQLYLLGVLPLFLLAMLCVYRPARAGVPAAESAAQPPEVSGRDEWLIIIALVSWGIALTLCIQSWFAADRLLVLHGSPPGLRPHHLRGI